LVKQKRNLKLILKSACLAGKNTAKLPLLCRAELFCETKKFAKANVLLQFGLDSLCGCLRWRGQETS
jgi:hypothetical protein